MNMSAVRLLNGLCKSKICHGQSPRFLAFLGRHCNSENEKVSEGSERITIELENAFKLYNLEPEPQTTVSLSKPEAKKLYVNMQTIRRFENACGNLYKEKEIRGFCHLYVGQEACCVGIHAAMRSQDTIITSYRSHGWTWLMGISIHSLIAELCQKQTGCSRGKGGSMHTFAPRFFGGNGIVGAQVSLGVGVAFAHAYRCDGGVNFACYGDGAANQGQIHEVFNIACLWKLPVVFVCENNKYGMGTSISRSSCSTDYYTRGDYIPGLWVNGMDVLAVRSATEFAIKHANTCGPVVMELETYRYQGHSMSDPGTSYRKREEIQMIRQKSDPIMTFRELCLKPGLVTEEEFKKIDNDIKMEVDEAVLKAKGDQEPNLQELTTDVYVNNLEKYIRGPILYNLGHFNVGQSFVPLGTPKATAKSDIKETPKEDESNIDEKAEVKAKNGSDSKKISAEKATEASKPPNKKINAPSKDNTSTENSPQPPPASSTRTDNNDKK